MNDECLTGKCRNNDEIRMSNFKRSSSVVAAFHSDFALRQSLDMPVSSFDILPQRPQHSLGLVPCFGIFGGRVGLATTAGRSTRFRITLPAESVRQGAVA